MDKQTKQYRKNMKNAGNYFLKGFLHFGSAIEMIDSQNDHFKNVLNKFQLPDENTSIK